MHAEAMIQSHFIDVISLTLGDPPKDRDWSATLAEFVGAKPLTSEALEREAKYIVATGNKAFPGFRRCREAIKAALDAPNMATRHGADEAMLSLTPAQRYHVMAAKHAAAHGGTCFNVTPDKTLAWDAWEAYFLGTGVHFMASRMASGNPVTTPAEYPWQFDGAANETHLRNAARAASDRRSRTANSASVPRVLVDWRPMAGLKPKPKPEPAKREVWEPDLSPITVSPSLLATLAPQEGF